MNKHASSSKKNTPEPPKRPVSGYIRYTVENRDQLKKKNPDTKAKDMFKLMSVEWNKLSEAQQKKYNDAFEKDKVKYEAEKKAYEDKYGPITKKSMKKAESSNDDSKRGRKVTKDKK